ncbi:MAG: hypothetical protein R2778_11960 [Saprospiraceae bacterium]
MYFAAAQGLKQDQIKGIFSLLFDHGKGCAANGSKTGVAIADVNADGYSRYLCLSGTNPAMSKLFINNKNLTFTERAAEFDLDTIFSKHSG